MTAVFLLLTMGSVTAAESGKEPDLRCGSYCLYVGLKALDLPVQSFDELEAKLGQPSPAGYSLGQLEEAARGYGVHTLGVQTTVENLQRRPGRFVCIAHLNESHFVNIAAIEERVASIIDPPRRSSVPVDTLRSQWDGTALLISGEPLLAEEDLPRELPWSALLLSIGGAVAVGSAWYMARRFLSKGARQ